MKGGASFVLRCLLVASLAATLAKAQAGDFCACEEGKDPPACPDNLLKTFGVSSEERSIQEEGDQALWALECAGKPHKLLEANQTRSLARSPLPPRQF